MSIATRPPDSTPADHARWARERQRELDASVRGDESKFGARYSNYDRRLTKILSWIGGITAVLVSTGAIWSISILVSTERSVAILLDRPAPVSKAQYDADRQEMLGAIHTLQGDVKDIQLKQAATIESNRTR